MWLVLAKSVRLFVCSLAFAWGWVEKSALRDVARKDECCWVWQLATYQLSETGAKKRRGENHRAKS